MKKQIRLTADAVVIKNGSILLVKRTWTPFKNGWALPGGFVEYGEKTEDACIRELEEEASIKGKMKTLIGAYSDPKRDPRGHTITIAYLVDYISGKLNSSGETREVKWFKLDDLPNLAFDHKVIIKDALHAIRRKNCEKD